MIDRKIEQAVLIGTQCVARSPGFSDDMVAWAEQVIAKYGELPRGKQSLIVVRFGKSMAVVQVDGRQFYFLAFPVKLYKALHDPFRIGEKFQADFNAHGDLPSLKWPADPAPARTLQEVQSLLQSGASATLLGTAQAIVDGGQVAYARTTADAHTLRHVWSLLPNSVRGEITMATFAPNNSLRFDLLATPTMDSSYLANYLTEESAGDYPEGRYELALQVAAETNDTDAIDRLFARRSMSQAVRLALTLLITTILLGLSAKIIPWERLR